MDIENSDLLKKIISFEEENIEFSEFLPKTEIKKRRKDWVS